MNARRWIAFAFAFVCAAWDSMDNNGIAATIEMAVALLILGGPNDPPRGTDDR